MKLRRGRRPVPPKPRRLTPIEPTTPRAAPAALVASMTPRNDDVLVVDVHSGSVRSVPWLRTPAALPCPCPPGAHDYDLANPGCPRTTFDARHDEARASGRELVAFVDGTNNVRWGFLKRSAELEM